MSYVEPYNSISLSEKAPIRTPLESLEPSIIQRIIVGSICLRASIISQFFSSSSSCWCPETVQPTYTSSYCRFSFFLDNISTRSIIWAVFNSNILGHTLLNRICMISRYSHREMVNSSLMNIGSLALFSILCIENLPWHYMPGSFNWSEHL